MSPEIEILLRKKLTEEEFLIVDSHIETLINEHRTPQNSSKFIKMINHFRSSLKEGKS
jgi:hypothetical protein